MPERLPLRESVPLAVVLFGFWIVLSGKLDFFHLAAGAVSAAGIAYASYRLYAVTPQVGLPGRHPFATMPWLRLGWYLPWLAWQIVVASAQVARIVLSPKMKLHPVLFRFEHQLPHNLARATLASSITLTPGTVTLDVRGDEFLVHALTRASADALRDSRPGDKGDMKFRVSSVFAEEVRG